MKTYDARDVTVIVSGNVITGFAEGSFVNCEKEEDNYTTHVGAQGEVARARNAHPVGTITLTLKSTSPSNSVLTRLAKSRDTFPAYVIDGNDGKEKIGGSDCWIQKPADREWGAEVTTREWTIVVADYDVN